eukprot:gene12661-biopygen11016
MPLPSPQGEVPTLFDASLWGGTAASPVGRGGRQKKTRLGLDKSMAQEKWTGQVGRTRQCQENDTGQGKLTRTGQVLGFGKVGRELDKARGKVTRDKEKWTRTGQVPRCWGRGLDKNWTSRAGQPGVGRTLDKRLHSPPVWGGTAGTSQSAAAARRAPPRTTCAKLSKLQDTLLRFGILQFPTPTRVGGWVHVLKRWRSGGAPIPVGNASLTESVWMFGCPRAPAYPGLEAA